MEREGKWKAYAVELERGFLEIQIQTEHVTDMTASCLGTLR